MQGWVSGGGKVLVVSSPSSLKLVLAGLICDGLPFSAAVDKLVPQLMRMNIDRQDDFFLQVGWLITSIVNEHIAFLCICALLSCVLVRYCRSPL